MRAAGVTDLVTVVCAVVVTSVVLVRQCSGPPVPTETAIDTSVIDWPAVRAGGLSIEKGDSGAIEFVVFSDFECPACRAFTSHAMLPALRQYPGRISLHFRHWPLSYHRFAYPLALAAECANEQGRFREFHDLVFAKHDSIGFTPIREFASAAGVADLSQFDSCVGADRYRKKIMADAALAVAVGGKGTPVVIVDGKRLMSPPDSAGFDRLIQGRLEARATP